MTNTEEESVVEKLETGIPGFDHVSNGGLPKNRTTLISGTAGSGKTVFATQFLVIGLNKDENGVFVTFEEPPRTSAKICGALAGISRAGKQKANGHL